MSSGLTGLDEILGGGFVLGRLHLVEGRPGTGKTTVDMAMPGMNGVELITRARERQGDLRAMLVTGYADVAGFRQPTVISFYKSHIAWSGWPKTSPTYCAARRPGKGRM